MDKQEIIETNTCGYIKVDKLFITDVKKLKSDYLEIKIYYRKGEIIYSRLSEV